MTSVGKLAQLPADDNKFIPQSYNPSDNDVQFVGAMGILAILTYGFTFVGAISFMVFCIHTYNVGKPEERSGSYFQGRMGFYSGMLAFAGLVQMLLGAFCRVRFGFDVLEDGHIQAALLVITHPTMSIFAGLFQVLVGVWGVFRSVGYHQGPNDNGFQIFVAVQWILVLSIQCIAQIGYLPGGELAAAAPTFIAMSFALNVMPAFLDHKMRTLPLQLDADYYSVGKPCDSSTSSEGSMTKECPSYDSGDNQLAPLTGIENEVDV